MSRQWSESIPPTTAGRAAEVRGAQSRCRFALRHADITPPTGIYARMWGAARHDCATGVHRPLRATVLAVAPLGGGDPHFLAALDWCLVPRSELDDIREHAGVGDRLTVVASHTHAAGMMTRSRAGLPGGDLIPPYVDSVCRAVAGLVKEAAAAMRPATLCYAVGRCALACPRDWDDGTQWVCGPAPGAAADDTVTVARATGDGGEALGTVVNYACHPTTLAWQNTLLSPDYPGAVREVVEGATGAPCVFLQGASGDLGPKVGFVGDPAQADRNGRELGYAALSAMEGMPPPGMLYRYKGPVVSGATIADWEHVPRDRTEEDGVWRREELRIPLPLRPGLATRKEEQRTMKEWEAKAAAAGDAAAAGNARAMAERSRRNLGRLMMLPEKGPFPLNAEVTRMGGALWVVVQGEHYSALQTQLRARFPAVPIIVATLAGDPAPSYLPPRDVYGRGVYQEQVAVLAPGCLEQVIRTIGDTIARSLTLKGGPKL